MKRSRRLATTALCALGCVLASRVPAPAHEGLYPLCPFILHERQVELDDLEVEIELARARLEVAEEIFVLVEGLWDKDLVERLAFLQGKQHRDRARADLERAQRRAERQNAIVDQYRLVCSAPADRRSAARRSRALEQAYRRYREADCKVRALDISFAEVELEHLRENLTSVRALRADDIASQEQVILAEYDVDLMVKQLEQARQRAARCEREIAEQWGERPE